jgi:hypothetical protein
MLAEAVVQRANALAARGEWRHAIEVLTDANRSRPDARLAAALVEVRVAAWEFVDRSTGPRDLPEIVDLFPGECGIPEIGVEDLSVDVVRSAVRNHGALIVRGLVPRQLAERLRAGIDQSWSAIARYLESKVADLAWYCPVQATGYGADASTRIWGLRNGTAYVADSPQLFFELLDAFDAVGLRDVLAEYFGEPPMLSLAKTAQRRLPPDAKGGWHQDAAVYGTAAHALDVWIPMSRCGDVAPGLEFWPHRLDNVLESIGPGALEFGARPELVAQLTNDAPSVCPIFEAGDAAIFDELTLHQTSSSATFTQPRYGFESWFFTPSSFPDPDLRVPIVY